MASLIDSDLGSLSVEQQRRLGLTLENFHSPNHDSYEHSGSLNPEDEGVAVHNLTASKSASTLLAMDTSKMLAHSFNGFPTGGDTQEFPSQELLQTHIKSMKEVGETSVQAHSDTLGTYDNTELSVEGHVDLEGHLGASSPLTSQLERDFLKDDTQTDTQIPLPRNFATPETPALAGRKHGRDGEILRSDTTAAKTPSYAHAFAFAATSQNEALMGQTQLFQQTQNHSSPTAPTLMVADRSDAVSSRPSPDLGHVDVPSSPFEGSSSPTSTRLHRHVSSAPDEPRVIYTSMKESQEHRNQRHKEERLIQLQEKGGKFSDEDDMMNDTQDYRRRRRDRIRMQRTWSEQDVLSKVAAPVRLASSGRRSNSAHERRQTIDLETPVTMRRQWDNFITAAAQGKEPIEVDDSGEEGDEEGEMNLLGARGVEDVERDVQYSERDDPVDDHTPDDDEPADTELDAEDNDMYDELNQHIVEHDRDMDEESTHASVEQPDEHDKGEDEPAEEVHSNFPRKRSRLMHSTPISTIADSQPNYDQTRSVKYCPYLPGSQHVGRTSEEQALLRSPAASARSRVLASQTNSQFEAQESASRIPSSPPRSSTQRQEIPDSEPLEADGTSTDAAQRQDIIPLYSTARTHISGSAQSPTKASAVANNQVQPSPRRAAGVRRFAEVARDVTLPPSTSFVTDNSEVDVGAIMDGLLTEEDNRFAQMISSPQSSRKRRRINDASALAHRIDDEYWQNAPRWQKEAAPIPQDQHRDDLHAIEADQTAAATIHAPELREPRELHSRVNEPSGLEQTPESVRTREAAGRTAVSQLISARPGKKPKQTKDGRASNRRISSKGRKGPRLLSEVQTTTNEPSDETKTGPAPPTEQASSTEYVLGAVVAPERIFALFKGRPHYFYPATWLGESPDGMTCKVKFDDKTVTQIETHHVRRLQLRIGDVVKVDAGEMRKRNWMVVGYGHLAQTEEERTLGTDVYGHTHVKVQLKSRDSMPTAANPDVVYDVLVNYLYLTNQMWPRFGDRTFDHQSMTKPDKRSETPMSVRTSTSGLDTPSSRPRRALVPTAKARAGRASHLRETSVASSDRSSRSLASGIFSGMAFAVSYSGESKEKAEVTRLVARNGGTLLEEGFEELFDLPDVSGEGDGVSSPALRLKDRYRHLRFAAVIADRHSRKAKYIQALALGLPTLSGRWIIHSLDEGKNPSCRDTSPLAWEKYLLPAGESSYLGGAVRSRTGLFSCEVRDAKLEDMIKNRPKLFNEDGVLLVAPNKGTAGWERRQTFVFLTLALGAGRVRRVNDVMQAKEMIEEDDSRVRWKWVYTDGDIVDARKILFEKKKRKKDKDSAVSGDSLFATNGNTTLVTDEFVIQSLILEALVD